MTSLLKKGLESSSIEDPPFWIIEVYFILLETPYKSR